MKTKIRHFYEVIINHETFISFYTGRTYEVGDTRNGMGRSRDGDSIIANGVITSIISHEEF